MFLYRYEDRLGPLHLEAHLEKYTVVKETPCGYWHVPIRFAARHENLPKKYKRWVSKTANQRYCYPTVEEAWDSYTHRKQSQFNRLSRDLEWVGNRLNWIKNNPGTPEKTVVKMALHGLPEY